MITCNECHATHLEGALFCSECGHYLQEQGIEITVELAATDSLKALVATRPLDAPGTNGKQASQVTFIIPSSGRQLELSLNNEILIGRSDAQQKSRPALDLTQDQGAEYGVSRRHASLQISERGVVLVDLDSTNGTQLNGHFLSPNWPFPVHNGDEIHFGKLLVHVFFDM
jgi:pSer/pThr/pTyr-binding forkhead associated (FHA) protein